MGGTTMSFNELVQKLEKHGFKLISTGKSSKRIYSNGVIEVNVHYHSNKEVKKGMANKILRDAGIR